MEKETVNTQPSCCCACSGEDLPWSGRGTDLPIAGCRFSLYPMTDGFVDVILGALEKTNTEAVWSESDALSTVYRGKLPYVADAVKALFIHAWHEGLHMALEGQYSKGCPGDIDGDSKLDITSAAPNAQGMADRHFPVICKLALYPMGTEDYIPHIADVWRLAEAKGLNPVTIHYATRISGDVHEVFDYLEEVCSLMDGKVSHYILHFTVSCNSPTKEEN